MRRLQNFEPSVTNSLSRKLLLSGWCIELDVDQGMCIRLFRMRSCWVLLHILYWGVSSTIISCTANRNQWIISTPRIAEVTGCWFFTWGDRKWLFVNAIVTLFIYLLRTMKVRLPTVRLFTTISYIDMAKFLMLIRSANTRNANTNFKR